MQQINSYIYDNTVLVQIDNDLDVEQRNRVVYTRPIQLYQGVDNIVKVKVQNGDQKPVNVSTYVLTFNLIDDYVTSNANVVFSTNVVMSNANVGLGSVTIPAANIASLDREQYIYSIKANVGLQDVATYVDDNWGAAGQIQINKCAYPS